ncbi:MAG: histidine kinase [Sphingobacteriaceae bacterium]|nr:histidine kinase [Sphingobacteriaceae bacterium]
MIPYYNQKITKVADINFKYETDKQARVIKQINLDREKKELELEFEKQRSRNNFYIASFIIIIVLLGGGLFFNSFKQKQKQARIQLENEKLMADINFLKAQVDPHTIFNTINTIHGQLAVDVKSGRDNLVKFSELMHYQLYECNDKFVDVEKEIQHLEKYVDLQKLRRSGKIELECYIDPSLKEMFVAPFYLFRS